MKQTNKNSEVPYCTSMAKDIVKTILTVSRLLNVGKIFEKEREMEIFRRA